MNTITVKVTTDENGCELLSDFVYSFFEHNIKELPTGGLFVVNCFQILYIRSLNTIPTVWTLAQRRCELLSDFVYSFFEHNPHGVDLGTTAL